MAAYPHIPDPLDDDEDDVGEFAAVTAGAAKESAPQEEAEESASQGEDEGEDEAEMAHSSFFLDKLPVEIRFMIYKEILTVPQPINVHSGWQQVYRRGRPSIPIDILCTCRRFYDEAINVLYGSNTFLYRLRDEIPRMTDVDVVAHIDQDGVVLPSTTNVDDEAGDEDDDEEPDDPDDPDWQEDVTTNARSQNTLKMRLQNRVSEAQPGIHVQKHAHLFRRIIIEAEKNRSSQCTKNLMANAIQTFAFNPSKTAVTGKHAPPSATNIKTLTIRVSPKWEEATPGADTPGRFTFVDFFHAHSAVIQAIENLNCQFLQLDLMTAYMDRSLAHSGRRFTMDMRYKRIERHVRDHGQDAWAHDKATQQERRRNVGMVEAVLRSLDVQVQEFCQTFLRHEVFDEDGWAVIPVAGGDDDDDDDDDYVDE
ncbi:hypothetical protein E4U54_001576 [Claviceps lovelessii]|nr:hypothetical protein E4U54_001576 [Claviceps lovelessii]